jgi:hypothetical protein
MEVTVTEASISPLPSLINAKRQHAPTNDHHDSCLQREIYRVIATALLTVPPFGDYNSKNDPTVCVGGMGVILAVILCTFCTSSVLNHPIPSVTFSHPPLIHSKSCVAVLLLSCCPCLTLKDSLFGWPLSWFCERVREEERERERTTTSI